MMRENLSNICDKWKNFKAYWHRRQLFPNFRSSNCVVVCQNILSATFNNNENYAALENILLTLIPQHQKHAEQNSWMTSIPSWSWASCSKKTRASCPPLTLLPLLHFPPAYFAIIVPCLFPSPWLLLRLTWYLWLKLTEFQLFLTCG